MAPSTLSRCLFCGETIGFGNYCSFRCRKQGLKQAMFEAKANREIEAAGQESQQWISVDERLPEESEIARGSTDIVFVCYLCEDGQRRVTTGYCRLEKRGWILHTLHNAYIVTHWQPLPAPPPPPVEEEFKLGRCGNCQHWEQVTRNAKILGNIGQCQKISVLKIVPDGFEWVDPITGDSFGCIQFEPREEE